MAYSCTRNKLNVVDLGTGLVTPLSIGDSLWDLIIDQTESTLFVTDRGTDEVRTAAS